MLKWRHKKMRSSLSVNRLEPVFQVLMEFIGIFVFVEGDRVSIAMSASEGR
jgi:hypothetical protein